MPAPASTERLACRLAAPGRPGTACSNSLVMDRSGVAVYLGFSHAQGRTGYPCTAVLLVASGGPHRNAKHEWAGRQLPLAKLGVKDRPKPSNRMFRMACQVWRLAGHCSCSAAGSFSPCGGAGRAARRRGVPANAVHCGVQKSPVSAAYTFRSAAGVSVKAAGAAPAGCRCKLHARPLPEHRANWPVRPPHGAMRANTAQALSGWSARSKDGQDARHDCQWRPRLSCRHAGARPAPFLCNCSGGPPC